MKSMQYTIRSIPPKVDQALRARAKKTGKSLNEIAVEALAKGAGVGSDAEYHDLDWFFGGLTLDQEAFDEAMDWLNSLPMDLDSQ